MRKVFKVLLFVVLPILLVGAGVMMIVRKRNESKEKEAAEKAAADVIAAEKDIAKIPSDMSDVYRIYPSGMNAQMQQPAFAN